MTAQDLVVIDAMRRFGGDFARTLAELATRADMENLQLIKATWPTYWANYADLAERDAARKAQRGQQ